MPILFKLDYFFDMGNNTRQMIINKEVYVTGVIGDSSYFDTLTQYRIRYINSENCSYKFLTNEQDDICIPFFVSDRKNENKVVLYYNSIELLNKLLISEKDKKVIHLIVERLLNSKELIIDYNFDYNEALLLYRKEVEENKSKKSKQTLLKIINKPLINNFINTDSCITMF